MARYQVILSYDGSNFAGFQRQATGRSVQGEVEAALRELGWQGRAIQSAGRTDTGVHASGQVIAFDLDWNHSEAVLLAALNGHLPLDIAAREIHQAPPGFQPRYWALYRRYVYQVFCDPLRNPLRERYAWRVWPPLDLERLKSAAALLIGTHDFAAFGSPTQKGGTTVRRVFLADWHERGDELSFEVTANAFLYRMVRRMVYLCVRVGQGELELTNLKRGLLEQVPLKPGMAPPQGLTLVEVAYPPLQENDLTIYAESSKETLAVSGDDDSGQDIRP